MGNEGRERWFTMSGQLPIARYTREIRAHQIQSLTTLAIHLERADFDTDLITKSLQSASTPFPGHLHEDRCNGRFYIDMYYGAGFPIELR